jgi:hypothetical protein
VGEGCRGEEGARYEWCNVYQRGIRNKRRKWRGVETVLQRARAWGRRLPVPRRPPPPLPVSPPATQPNRTGTAHSRYIAHSTQQGVEENRIDPSKLPPYSPPPPTSNSTHAWVDATLPGGVAGTSSRAG